MRLFPFTALKDGAIHIFLYLLNSNSYKTINVNK